RGSGRYGGGSEARLGGARYGGTVGLGWRPDGTRCLFSRAVAGDRGRALWSAKADGTDMRELAIEGTAVWPAVSPDGRTLAFFGGDKGRFGLWRSDPDGANSRLLSSLPDAQGTTLAPDGRS